MPRRNSRRNRLRCPHRRPKRSVEAGELAVARAALGESAFAAAWDEGRRLSLEDVLALTLTELADIGISDSAAPRASLVTPDGS